MGLSKKLGGGTTSRAVEYIGPVDYTWSTQAYSIGDILTRFQLPCVVQCSEDAGSVLWADFSFDMRQPLLLHAARTVKKIHARSLRPGEQSGELEEYGPPLAIPEDYDGWFFPVQRKDLGASSSHMQVDSVAASAGHKFLVTSTLHAFAPNPVSRAAGSKHVEHEVSVGEVLTKVGVVKGDPSHVSSPTSLVSKSRQSLRCLDENGREVILPFQCRCLLYDVAENYGVDTHRAIMGTATHPQEGISLPGVVHTSTLVASGNRCLPRLFRHVLGEMPALADAFTGLLRCYSIFTEETVMAASMIGRNVSSQSRKSSFLEMATDSSTKFRIALNASELRKSPQYAMALKTCEEQAPRYVRAIKVSFTLQPLLSTEQQKQDTAKTHSDQENRAAISEADLKMIHQVMQAGDVQVSRAEGEAESYDAFGLDGDHQLSDPRNDYSAMNEEDRDNESITTDEVANSFVDTTSLSDATDIPLSDNISDVVEVEANSEFDFTWGQLKRARSFSGSVSSLTEDSSTGSTDTDSEDSTTLTIPESTASHNSTLTRGTTNSSNSGNTVVMRASAPSPVYANLPKTLALFPLEQEEGVSCDPVSSDGLRDVSVACSNTTTAYTCNTTIDHTDYTMNDHIDHTMIDHTVQSVWDDSLPTEGTRRVTIDRVEHEDSACLDVDFSNGGGKAEPIWWGDGMCSPEQDSINSSQVLGRMHPFGESPAQFLKSSVVCASQTHHQQLAANKSPRSSQANLPPHPMLSAKSSVHSEGSVQDLAIQRLERAMSEATEFLKTSAPPMTSSVFPPVSEGRVTTAFVSSKELYFDSDSGSDGPVTACSHQEPSQYPHYFGDVSIGTRYRSEGQLSTEQPAQLQTRHHSDSQLDADSGTHRHVAQCDTEGQTELDFVRTLGDRLMAVSRKSSLPKYQRLHAHTDDLETDSETRDKDSDAKDKYHQLRKRWPRMSSLQDSVDEGGGGDGEVVQCVDGTAGLGQRWDSSQTDDAISEDFDLLPEDVV